MRRNQSVGPGNGYTFVSVLMMVLIGLPLMLIGKRVSAQALTPLYTFSGKSDGAYPGAGLVLDNRGHLYGTAAFGGTAGGGVIFTINTDGSGFAVLHNFSGTDGNGFMPVATLTLDRSGHLYGTAKYGNNYDGGVVYLINTDGSGFTVLYRFSAGSSDGQGGIINTDGALPMGNVILGSSGNLYGTTYTGGPHAGGVIFTLKTNGTGFKVLHNMKSATDGYRIQSGLVLDSGGHLYGTAYLGGVNDNGTVFTLNTNGSGFKVLHPFSASAADGANADGANPLGSLLLDGNGHLYGTAYTGGPNGTPTGRGGTVFALNVDGSNFMVLLNFIDNPTGSLIFDGSGRLYGTSEDAVYGVFTVKTDGSMVSPVGSFTGNPDGSDPAPGLVLDGTGHFYGTASAGGTYGAGTVFSGSVVGLLPTTTTLQSSLSTLIEGTPITLTASIAGSGTPLTGLLTVTDSAQGTLGRTAYQGSPFSVTFYPVTGTHTLTAIYGGDSTHQSSSQAIQVVVQPNPIKSITVKPTGVTGSLQATGIVTLQGPAGPGGISMSLTSSNPTIASVPASLTIAQGTSAGSFSIATAAVAASTNVKITATISINGFFSTKTVVLHVLPVGLATFKLNHATVTGGAVVTGTVALTAPASGAITVSFGSSNTAVVPVPASITIPAGSTSGTVTLDTNAVTANTSVTLSATANGLTKTAVLTVKP